MKYLYPLFLLSCLTGPSWAQSAAPKAAQPQQLFTSNKVKSSQQLLAPRSLQYWPEEEGIVCVNGKNRFTRALYGRCEAARLETSDEPEFGLYMPYMGGNVRFDIDHTEIKATYDGVSRDYKITLPTTMRQNPEQEAFVLLSAYALQVPAAGGIWQIEGHNVRRGVELQMRYGAASNTSFSRNGDMGVDKPDCFDFTLEKCKGNDYTLNPQTASFILTYGQGSKKGQRKVFGQASPSIRLALEGGETKEGTTVQYLTGSIPLDQPTLLAIGNLTDSVCSLQTMLMESQSVACALVADYEVNTPDDMINPLEYVLPAAANGIWDEESGVWQHGAIGWRMPLPGWRAAYVGDVMGWQERQLRHFSGYASSQLVNVPVDKTISVLDPTKNLARATEKIGNPMYTTGYIGRYPNNTKKINHYDMNLVFIDELLWHLRWSGDKEEAKVFWPVIKRHLDWEKRVFDPDNDGLYDAYCCIWASDGLYYDGGAVTHSSAYNLRAHREAARIGRLLGDEQAAEMCEAEAQKIASAIDRELWLEDEGVWAECKDFWGLKRPHKNPGLWTIYHAIDSEVGTLSQRRRAVQWVENHIPHYCIKVDGDSRFDGLSTISTTNWQPYGWSINNVALAEEMHTALSFWQAGCPDAAYKLFKGALVDGMYLGGSPGNIGQISYYDAARGECYRDFGDPVGITCRTVVQGLIGIQPDFLEGVLVLKPGFPSEWKGKEVSFATPDFELRRTYQDNKPVWYFQGQGDFAERYDSIVFYSPDADCLVDGELADSNGVKVLLANVLTGSLAQSDVQTSNQEETKTTSSGKTLQQVTVESYTDPSTLDYATLVSVPGIAKKHNLKVADIFKQKYVYKGDKHQRVTLSMPTHGMGEWCHPKDTFQISNALGLKAAFTSQWKNFPNRLTFKLPKVQGSRLYLKMVGTTNPMQCRIANGVLRVHYKDGSVTELVLENPVNWWPIEQDLVQGLPAFYLKDYQNDVQPPYRMSLLTGAFYRPEAERLNAPTDGGAATCLEIPLEEGKVLKSLELECLSNDVVMGIIDAYVQPVK